MPDPITAIAAGSIVGAGASIYGANKGASAVKKAAKKAADTELQMYQQSREDLAPYRQVGYGALDMLAKLYGVPTGGSAPAAAGGYGPAGSLTGGMQTGGPFGRLGDSVFNAATGKMDPRQPLSGGSAAGGAPATRDLSGFYASPDYQFRMQQAMKSLGNTYAARGLQNSGPEAAALLQRSGDLASGEFNNYVSRLASLAGIGQTATNTTAQLGANTAGNLSNIYVNAGNARASTYANMAGGINSAIQGGLQNWAFNSYLNSGRAGPIAGPSGSYWQGFGPGINYT
jgi:hypothetical protein